MITLSSTLPSLILFLLPFYHYEHKLLTKTSSCHSNVIIVIKNHSPTNDKRTRRYSFTSVFIPSSLSSIHSSTWSTHRLINFTKLNWIYCGGPQIPTGIHRHQDPLPGRSYKDTRDSQCSLLSHSPSVHVEDKCMTNRQEGMNDCLTDEQTIPRTNPANRLPGMTRCHPGNLFNPLRLRLLLLHLYMSMDLRMPVLEAIHHRYGQQTTTAKTKRRW